MGGLCSLSYALDNGFVRPPMGWNSWNKFACNVDEALIRETADAMVNSGLAAAGYEYIVIDDCWQSFRDTNGTIHPDYKTFPSGMRALADYVHSKDLLFGLYTDAGIMTCQGRPGSLGFEDIDAKTYADWEVDFVKVDNCHNNGVPALLRYTKMRDALNVTGRPIFYSICNWGEEYVWKWAQNVGNSFRTTEDIGDHFNPTSWRESGPCYPCGVVDIIDRMAEMTKYATIGSYPDPDMLEVGNGGMSYEEYKTHFTFWAAFKAPLIIGCDLRNMSPETLQILTAEEVIAVNQDPLGKAVQRVRRDRFRGVEVWAGPLKNDDTVVVHFSFDLGMTRNSRFRVRDLWQKKDIGDYVGQFEAKSVPGHGVVKRILGKKQNRPISAWIRFRTDNAIRYNAKRRHWRRTKLNL
ncbi:uncharacterized protein VTP21DRAFT_7884 [Calcarisporiella thermophila]|uniref:uncharacterized protein n=1 Tax=Calcarisporiella thermophila TaxID=911321 RepID=UPI0037442C86